MSFFVVVQQKPVEVAHFESHVERLRGNENHGFSLEYSVIIVLKTVFAVIYVLDRCSSLEEKPINITLLQLT